MHFSKKEMALKMHLERSTQCGRHEGRPIRAPGYRTASRPIVLLECRSRGTTGVHLTCTLYFPQGSDNTLPLLINPPGICRACRPTPRRHFAHTAVAMLCEMAKRRLLRCP